MKYFEPFELVDRATFERLGDDALQLFNPVVLQALDNLREFFGVPITVNNWHSGGSFEWRGYRTLQKAAELGAPKSKHAIGEAFDCDIRGYTAEQARQIIKENEGDPLLKLITRMERDVSWVHFDIARLAPGVRRIYLFKA